MKAKLSLVVMSTMVLNCNSASANWRDDNPNQPNGYAASMYRYHHGTPDDDGPHDGYAATEIRARHGLDRFAPPSDDAGDGWGDSGGGGSRWGGGGGLGRHFRQGQQESQSYWKQRMQGQMRAANMGARSGQFGGGAAAGHAMQQSGTAGGGYARPMQQYGGGIGQAGSMGGIPPVGYVGGMPPVGNMGGTAPVGNMGGMPSVSQYVNYPDGAGREMPRFNVDYNQYANHYSGNYQYAPPNVPYNNNYANSTALRSALSQRPMGTLLRQSQGGFNRIYASGQ